MLRPLLPLPVLLVLVALVALVRPARADEIFILDNGDVFRGWVIQEKEDSILVRLSGFPREARVDVPRTRLVRRFAAEPVPRSRPLDPEILPESPPVPDVAPAVALSPPEAAPGLALARAAVREEAGRGEVPEAEVAPEREGFFPRLARTVVLSLPQAPAERMALAVLLLLALVTLVLIGGRVAEVETMTFWRGAALAALLGAILVLDVYLYGEVLRADRAVWMLPVQAALWLVAARGLLKVGLGRTVLLFAFLTFNLAVVVCCAGAIVMSF